MGAYQSAQYFVLQDVCGATFLKYETYSFKAPCSGLQGAVAQYAADLKPRQTPPLYDKLFYLPDQQLYNTTHPKDEALWLSVLLHVPWMGLKPTLC